MHRGKVREKPLCSVAGCAVRTSASRIGSRREDLSAGLGGLELRNVEGKLDGLRWPLCEGHMRLVDLLEIDRAVRGRLNRGKGLQDDARNLEWVTAELQRLREQLSQGVSVDITGDKYADGSDRRTTTD